MAFRLPNLSQDNVSLKTIPLAWIIALAPRIWSRHLYRRALNKDMDTAHPREFTKAVVADSALDDRTRKRIIRSEGAMFNGLENLGLFAAAVVAGNAAGLSTRMLNGLSLGYCASRVVYNFVYINAETPMQAHGRATIFLVGISCIFHLFFKSAEKFQRV